MNISEKLTQIAENEQKVYDAGYAAGIAEEKDMGQYELIETITLSEVTTLIERTQEPDGTAYNLKDLIIRVTSQDGTTLVLNKWILTNVYFGSKSISIFRSTTIGTNSGQPVTIIKTESDRNYRFMSMTGSTTNTGLADINNTKLTSVSFALTNENISKLTLQHEVGMPVGTIIEIYGVRA